MSRAEPLGDELSDDAVFGGALQIRQRRRGYRFNVDALWLVAAARPHAHGVVCDLGAGSGVVGLALGLVPDVDRVVLVERQQGLAQLCRHNALQLAACTPVQVEQQDLRQLKLDDPVDLVVSNPPYFDPASSRPPHDAEIDQARRALHGDLQDFAEAAARLLGPDGCWVSVLPANMLEHITRACQHVGFHVDGVRPVHPRSGQPARILLVSARPGSAGSARHLQPILEADGQGAETDTAAALRQSHWITATSGRSPLR